ncbi:MAG: 5-formyltetrahydrofolate cyclo-ligase [Lachnospiraceae bacterium]|nr:5-formyltetrahydrofolate cyclo-ligase [Lachnospiraceae bacterium]
MNMEERVKRINELYHKSQREPLTPGEKEEQALLRREYAASIRGNLQAQLDSIRIKRPDGAVEKLKKKNNATESIAEAKRNIRNEVLKRRSELSIEERSRASLVITDRIIGHQWFYGAEIILAFVGYGSEIDTSGIINEALRCGKKVYTPKVSGNDMSFYRIYDFQELKRGFKGIPEPSGLSERYDYYSQTDTVERSLLLMPGVAFDKEKNRIGYGKGYYDRYLQDKEELRLHSIAIGFSCQLVDTIPRDEHDIRPYQVICV